MSIPPRICFAVATIAALVVPGPAPAEELRIGTGATTGVYFQVGRAICRILNETDPVEGLSCAAESTPGSLHNLAAVRAGELEVGVVQSDWQHHAVRGTSGFADAGADESLRALFSVHGEPFTLVVREDSGIGSIAELAGRRVNIGNPGSGQRGTMEAVMEAMGWSAEDFALATELTAAEHGLALCHDRVEAIVYTVGHPNASIAQATGLCDARIAAVSGPEIDALVDAAPFYAKTEVPGGIYAANPEPVPTFGVTATVVASADLPEETAYRLVSRVFENFETFRKAHPAFGYLRKEDMVAAGLSAPLHPGAVRYFREAGLVAEPAGEAEDETGDAGETPEDADEATAGEPAEGAAAESEAAAEPAEAADPADGDVAEAAEGASAEEEPSGEEKAE
ncbi:MAG TPA: TAXI family TRAP transporter solute-binding subunit [Thermohalobaculum sp.]|nr:TAXI family TRAP transporter solute-binding subunit [Thermohalobaculum sp.]